MLWGLIFSCLVCGQRQQVEETGWWDSQDWWRDSGAECDPWISIRDADGERVDELDFGTVSAADTTELTLYIENKGDCDLEIVGMALGDPDSAFAAGDLDWPVVEPGGSEPLVLSFSPTEAGDFTDTLYIQSNDPFSEFVEVQLQGTLSAGALEVDPESADFGTVEVGCEASQDFTLTNPGPGPLTIDSIAMETGSEDFSFASDTLPADLEADESLTARVVYTPSDEYEDIAYLTVSSSAPDDPELLLTVSGTGAYAGRESEDFVQSGVGRVFVLTEVAVESTVEVRVEGVLAGGWTFDGSANAVVFDEGNVPAEGATITVDYARQAVCEGE